MYDSELFQEIGLEFPKDFEFTKEDWEDFYATLSKFRDRALRRRGMADEFCKCKKTFEVNHNGQWRCFFCNKPYKWDPAITGIPNAD